MKSLLITTCIVIGKHIILYLISRCLFLAPGPPSNVHFPFVTPSTATIEWSLPMEQNGIITGYNISYVKMGPFTRTPITKNVGKWQYSYEAVNIERDSTYSFTVFAKSENIDGIPITVEVTTSMNRGKVFFTLLFSK